MAKIQVTESELRRIIKESVEEVMKESEMDEGTPNKNFQAPGFTQTASTKPEQTKPQPKPKKPGFISKAKNAVKNAVAANNEVEKNMTPQQRIGHQNVMRGGF